MPHLVILYTSNLEFKVNISQLCNELCGVMVRQLDMTGKRLFPTGGTRVFAFPAPHFSIADEGQASRQLGESGEYGFIYLNLRMAEGRDKAVIDQLGSALHSQMELLFAPVLKTNRIGITLHIDEKTPSIDAKCSSLNVLFP
jgi:5-carboxymethyl-2-hydroxymuconate isomerase